MEWQTIIGLEVHVQLLTNSKIFSGAPTAYGALPNHQACAIDLGFPGVLPVLNKEAVTMAIKFGLAIQAEMAEHSIFARKNYFYPDLPKGYQISQYEAPIVGPGQLTITCEDGSRKTINIIRAHLEEDAGKSLHASTNNMTGLDFNRAGTALLEIVSAPELFSAKEAISYLKTLHSLVCYLGICDGNMQEGSFRCDANVSVRPQGQTTLGTRTEIKNVNSFRFVERAIQYEAERQITILQDGGQIVQETRLYDSDRHQTRSMRSKEHANDYRYFPDPDLLPVAITADMIEQARATLPELPWQKQLRLQQQYHLNEYDAELLTASHEFADYFEEVVKLAHCPAKLAANWIMGELSSALNANNLAITASPIPASLLAQLLTRIEDQTISGKIAKTIFETLWAKDGAVDVDDIIRAQGLQQITDTSALEKIIADVIASSPAQLADYRAGKDKLFGYFVGQVMKATQGKANPQQVNQLLQAQLQQK